MCCFSPGPVCCIAYQVVNGISSLAFLTVLKYVALHVFSKVFPKSSFPRSERRPTRCAAFLEVCCSPNQTSCCSSCCWASRSELQNIQPPGFLPKSELSLKIKLDEESLWLIKLPRTVGSLDVIQKNLRSRQKDGNSLFEPRSDSGSDSNCGQCPSQPWAGPVGGSFWDWEMRSLGQNQWLLQVYGGFCYLVDNYVIPKLRKITMSLIMWWNWYWNEGFEQETKRPM